MTSKRLGYKSAATVTAAAACVSALLAGGAVASPAAAPKLVLSCSRTVVATLKGDTRGVRLAVFEFGAKQIVDRTKPYSARIPARKVAAVTLASGSFVYTSGQTIGDEAKVPRCKAAA